MNIQQQFETRFNQVIYPPGTPQLSAENSTHLGESCIKDLADHVEDFYRIWFTNYNSKTKPLSFVGLREVYESVTRKERFVSFSEYQEIFKAPMFTSDTWTKHPMFALANIKSETQRQRFVNTDGYTNDLKGYFFFMREKSPELYSLFSQPRKVRFPDEQKKDHIYIVGATKSGKSEAIKHLILQDYSKRKSAIISIESNGDLSEQLAMNKVLNPEDIIYVNFRDDKNTVTLNPFDLVGRSGKDTDDEIQKQSQIIMVAIKRLFADGQKVTDQMESVLTPCLDVVARAKGTLEDVKKFMVDELNSNLVEMGKRNPKYGEFFRYKFHGANLQPSRQGIYQKLSKLLNYDKFSNFFCGNSTFDIVKAIDEKKIIIFNLCEGDMGDLASEYTGRILIAMLQNLLFQRQKLDKAKRMPLNVFIDEFQDYADESTEKLLIQSRKYGVSLTIATQTVGLKMSADMTKTVLTNTRVKFIGKSGYDTLRIMSRETDSEIEALKKLSNGKFLCQLDTGHGFVVQFPNRHLGVATCRSPMEWAEVMEDQKKKKYYREVKETTSLSVNEIPLPPKDRKKNQQSRPENPKNIPHKTVLENEKSGTKPTVPEQTTKTQQLKKNEHLKVETPKKVEQEKPKQEQPKFKPKYK